MTTIDLVALAAILEPRIVKGAALLFEMEQAGERDARYDRWVRNYTRMVDDYDILTKCIILQGKTSVAAMAPLLSAPDPACPAGRGPVRSPEELDPEQTPLLLGADAPPARDRSLVEGF